MKDKAEEDFGHLSQWAVRGVRVGRAEGAAGAGLWGWGAKLGLQHKVFRLQLYVLTLRTRVR